MCDVMQRAVDTGKAEERVESIRKNVLLLKKHNISEKEIIEDIMESYELSFEDAEKYVKE